MDDSNQNDGRDGLAKYLLGTLLARWVAQRLKVEPNWRRHFAAFTNHPEFDTKGTWNLPDNAKKGCSDTFPDLTAQKCNSAFALLARSVFSGNRVNFSLVADELSHMDGAIGAVHESGDAERAERQNLELPAETDGGDGLGLPEVPPELPDSNGPAPLTEPSSVTAGMQSLMDRQSEACDEVGELGKAALSGAIYGEGAVEEFAMHLEEHEFVQTPDGGWDVQETQSDMLGSRFASIWNIWRDREATKRTDGDGYAIFDPCSPFDFARLLEDPLADATAVRDVLEQHREKADGSEAATVAPPTVTGRSPPAQVALLASGRPIKRYRFHARVPRSIYVKYLNELAARDGGEPVPESPDNADAFEPVELAVVVADGRVVRCVESEPESRLLHVFEWERTPDMPWAIGVAARVEPQQKSLMKAVRAMEDMILKAAKLILAGKRQNLESDLEKALENEEFIQLTDDVTDVGKAIQQFKIDAPVAALQAWIGFVIDLADLTSLIPRISQGQSDGTSAVTLGEIQRRLEQSGLWMLRVAGNFDAMIEEVLRSRFEFNMANPEIPNSLKGNFKLRVEGSQTFRDRYLMAENIKQALMMALNNPQLSAMSKIEPGWRQTLSAMGIDPDLWVKSRTEMMQDAAAMQQTQGGLEGEASAVQQAQINRLMSEARKADADTNLKNVTAAAKQAETVRKNAEAVHKLTTPNAKGQTPNAGQQQASPAPAVATAEAG